MQNEEEAYFNVIRAYILSDVTTDKNAYPFSLSSAVHTHKFSSMKCD